MLTTRLEMQEHLVVLIHGLQGNVGHISYLEKKLTELNPSILTLNARANDQGDVQITGIKDQVGSSQDLSKTGGVVVMV